MQHTLHEHIILLEQRIQILRDQLTGGVRESVEIERVSAEINTAELALLYYRKAFELENQTSQIRRAHQTGASTAESAGSSHPANDQPRHESDPCSQLIRRFFEATDQLLFGDLHRALGQAAT